MKTINYAEAASLFSQPNKIYKVYNNVDLQGNTLNIPAGCTLDIQGGRFSNGTMYGNATLVMSKKTESPFVNVTRTGTWEDQFGDVVGMITELSGNTVNADAAIRSDVTSLQSSVAANTSAISAEASRATARENELNGYIQGLSQSQPVPVTALPETGQQQGVIYRLAGATSYADYMWNGSSWVKMAEYDNAIDDVPTAGSNNLVKSGGILSEIRKGIVNCTLGYGNLYKFATLNGYIDSIYGYFTPSESDTVQTTFYDLQGTYPMDSIFLKVNENVTFGAKYYAFFTFNKTTGEINYMCLDGKHDYVNGFTFIKVKEGADLIGVITRFPDGGGDENDFCFDTIRVNNEVEVKNGLQAPYFIGNGYIESVYGYFTPYGSGTHQTTFYKLLPDKLYSLTANVSSGVKNYAFYNIDNGIISNPIDGCHKYVNGTRLLTIPKNANYIGVVSKFPDGEASDSIKLQESNKEYFIDNLFHNRRVKTIRVSKNGYIDSVNGNFTEYGSGTHQTIFYDLYNVKWGSYLVVKVSDNVTFGAKYCSFYGMDEINSISGKIDYNNGLNYIKIPEGAKCFGVVCKFPDGTGDENDFTVEYDNGGIIEEISNQYDWTGKNWLVVGDSLTEKNLRAVKNYFDYVSEITNVSVINKGASGNGYADGDWFYTAIATTDTTTYDFITIFGSGNDIRYEYIKSYMPDRLQNATTWEEALGNIDDVGKETLCGLFNRTFDKFYEVAPLKKFGVVTPTPWKNGSYDISQLTDSETYRRMDDYSNALVAICRKRGIPCLDLFHCSGLQPTIEAFREEYYKEENLQDTGVHPNSKGQKWISNMFLEFVKKYLIY